MILVFLILFNEPETAVTFTRGHFNQVFFAVQGSFACKHHCVKFMHGELANVDMTLQQ